MSIVRPQKIGDGSHLGTSMSHTDITARVTFLGEFTGEKFIEFGAENTVSDKLSLLADLGRHLDCSKGIVSLSLS